MKSILSIGEHKFIFEAAKEAVNVIESLSKALSVKDLETFGDSQFEGMLALDSVDLGFSIKDVEVATKQQAKEASKEYEENLAAYRADRHKKKAEK